ncbi:phage baseplate assembly protein V [Zymomonas mobilis]|nr:phage baseplate assembly protein V [Zymomonas mobilis]AHB11066.1 phage baseplate assembly protein V [Zymomonas mobilis subsp. mobilis str. CP4 = NRRL B-14023]
MHNLNRKIANMIAFGVVKSLSDQGAIITIADIDTPELPWSTIANKNLSIWSPPPVGAQVIVFAPNGDLNSAAIIGQLPSDSHPLPSKSESEIVIAFGDGTLIKYDLSDKKFTGEFAGDATLKFPQGLEIIGDLSVSGKVTAETVKADTITGSSDVSGGGISLKNHTHSTKMGPTSPPS